jgi:hypothetical protein
MRRTGIKRRLLLYEKAASKLRLAQICLSEKLAIEAVDELMSLNRRFENEDNPNQGN